MAAQLPVARHHVREEIQRRISSDDAQPGERLTQQSLAKELGVPQGAVRESLLKLHWPGLVEPVDRLGIFVRKLDASRMSEAYQVMEILEGLAARLACGHAARADISVLRKIAVDVWQLSRQSKEEEMGAADRAFHLQMIKLSRNQVLLRIAVGFHALGMAARTSRDPRVVQREHLRIVEVNDSNSPNEV
jgi:DNA-binding GntR family transcriptional regulator